MLLGNFLETAAERLCPGEWTREAVRTGQKKWGHNAGATQALADPTGDQKPGWAHMEAMS